MKVFCDREQMLAAFGMVSGVVPARSPKPILQNVKLVAAPGEGSTLMATDLEVGIRYRVLGVKPDQPGSVILPLQRMNQILRTSGDDELDIEVEGDQLIVRGSRSEFKLASEDPSLFPDPPDFAATACHSVQAGDLRRLIRRTIFATDEKSTRYALMGVLMELTDNSITMVGTDGRRLARQIASASAEGGAEPPGQTPVVPVKALRLIERNLGNDDESVQISVQSGTAVLVRVGQAVIYSRLVEGRFPRYQDVFPSSHEARIPFKEIQPLLQAVEQAAIVTSGDSRGVDFKFSDGLLRLEGQSADVGSSHVELPIVYDGKDVEITFDPGYLLDALKTLDPGQPIAAELIDHKSAAVFKTEDQYSYVVMPLNR
ncbi:DNA polymerase III subunit beta [soil metagenome]